MNLHQILSVVLRKTLFFETLGEHAGSSGTTLDAANLGQLQAVFEEVCREEWGEDTMPAHFLTDVPRSHRRHGRACRILATG